MFNRNHFEFIGNIASTPEVRTLGDGKRVCNLRIALNESWRDGAGNRQERAEFIPLTVWYDKTIDLVEKHIVKGAYVLVNGKVTHTKRGEGDSATFQTNLVANRFQFLEPKAGSPDEIGGEDDRNIPF